VSECKPCRIAERGPCNTVRVDPTLLGGSPTAGYKAHQQHAEEEVDVGQLRQDKERREGEERRRQEEEQQERLRLEAEAEEARRRQEAEVARRRAEEEAERRRQEEAAKAEAARQERERAAAADRAARAEAAAAKEKAEVEAAQQVVNEFLKARGFKNLLTPKKAFCGASIYPLHLAVEENKADTVLALLKCGADRTQKNSAKLSPLELAEKCNKKGSHDVIVQVLRS